MLSTISAWGREVKTSVGVIQFLLSAPNPPLYTLLCADRAVMLQITILPARDTPFVQQGL
jgi:hypothetical protein